MSLRLSLGLCLLAQLLGLLQHNLHLRLRLHVQRLHKEVIDWEPPHLQVLHDSRANEPPAREQAEFRQCT
jgi:hypothetical protein